MKQANPTPPRQRSTRRISGRAQEDHILDPYQRQKKLHADTVCPQCGAVYRDGRWQWVVGGEGVAEELCPACRRIHDRFPAGIITLRGDFAREHKDEIIHLVRHQEEGEKNEHPLNRIMSIEEDADEIFIKTTDIHLPRRIAEAIRRAFHGEMKEEFKENEYFVRIYWSGAT